MGEHAIILTPEGLRQFETSVLNHLTNLVNEMQAKAPEKPLCPAEAAEYLRISERTLWARLKDGTLPASLVRRSAGSVYFFATELHDHIKKSKSK